MSRPSYSLRRLVAVLAAVLAIGVAVHGACQAIEHHDGAKDALALCAAAVVLFAALRIVRGGGGVHRTFPFVWAPLGPVAPIAMPFVSPRRSAAWLQRFLN